jgi:hypothetical protein
MRPSNNSKTQSTFVSDADQRRQNREVINNRWNTFAKWATPKVKRVNEVVIQPAIEYHPTSRILDPRDGLVRRGLNVIDQAIESKDPEYKAKVIQSIKSGFSEVSESYGDVQEKITSYGESLPIAQKQKAAQDKLRLDYLASGEEALKGVPAKAQLGARLSPEEKEEKMSTFLTEHVYDPTNQTVGAAALALNPDTQEEAARRGIDPLTLAWEERGNISTGQATWDLIAGETAFGAENIYDEVERQELFYGEGFVSNVARGASGTIDVGAQLVFDPILIAGGAFKLARLATLDVKTVAQSTKGLNFVEQAMAGSGLADDIVSKPSFFEESFFKGGKKDLEEYRLQRAEQDANIARIKELEDDELLYSYRMGNAQDEIASSPKGDPEIARLTQAVEDSKKRIIEIRTAKDEIRSKPSPTISVGWDEFFDQVPNMKPSEIVKHKRLEIFGAGRDRMAAALALAAKTSDKRDLIDLTLLATNVDPQAGARLLARRDSIKPIIEDYKAQIKEIQTEILAIMDDSPYTAQALEEVRQDQINIFKALKTEDKFLRAAIGEEEEIARSVAGRLPNAGIARIPTFIPGNEAMTRSLERFRARQAKTRASIAMDRSLSGDDFMLQEFQISSLARPVYVAQWVGGKFGRFHPSNTVAIDGFDTSDGIDELASWMQSAPLWGKTPSQVPNLIEEAMAGADVKFTPKGTYLDLDKRAPEFRGADVTPGGTADSRQKLLDEYILAQDRGSKEKVLLKIERKYAEDVLFSLGYQADESELLIELFMRDKAKKLAMYRQENGFYPDPDTKKLISNPMMAKELEYRHLMMDAQEFYNFALLEKDAMQPIFRLVLDEEKNLGRAVDFIERSFRGMESLWKSGVLLRLGFAPRNIATELLKFKAFGGLLEGFLFTQLGAETLSNMAQNKFRFFERIGMRFEQAREVKKVTFADDLPEQMDPSLAELKTINPLTAVTVPFEEYQTYVAHNNKLRVARIKWLQEQIDMQPKKDLLPEEKMLVDNYTQKINELQADVIESERKLVIQAQRAEKSKKIRSGEKKIVLRGEEYEAPFEPGVGFAFREALSTASTTSIQTGMLDAYAAKGGAEFADQYGLLYPDDPEYYPNLAELINNRWVDTEISRVLLSGATADELEMLLLQKGSMWKNDFVATGNRGKFTKERAKLLDNKKNKDQESIFTKEQLDEISGVPTAEYLYAKKMIAITDDLFPTQEIRDRVLSMARGERLTINDLRNLYDDIGGSIKRPVIAGRPDKALLKKRAKLTTTVMVAKSETDPTLVRTTVEKTGLELERAQEAQRMLDSMDPKDMMEGFGDVARKLKNWGFKWLSVIPEDKYVSAPFGKMIYLREMDKSDLAFREAGIIPSGAQKTAASQAARDKAVEEAKRYLYRTNRRMKGVGDIPLLSPFIQAGIIGLKNWGRASWQDPTVLARRVWLWNQINEHADVDARSGRRSLTLRLPHWFIENINLLPGDQGYLKNVLRAYDTMRFSTQSLNLVLPGIRGESGFEQAVSTLGVGPLVTAPVAEYLKDHPYIDQTILDATGKAIPSEKVWDDLKLRGILETFVPAESLTADPTYYQTLPPWSRRLIAMSKQEDSAEFARTQMYLIMWHLHRQATGEEPAIDRNDPEAFGKFVDQTSKEATIHLGIRMAANLSLPLIPQWENSEMKPMMDLWNEYQEKEGVDAFPKFLEDHPEWFSVTMSLSEGNTGIRATTDAAYMANKHEDLIYAVTALGGTDASADPFIQMIVNRDDRPNTYDPAARINQIETTYGIKQETYRGRKTPASAYMSLKEKQGWTGYMSEKAIRDYLLYQVGIQAGLGQAASPNMKIAEPVNAQFKAWIDSQQEENPEWFNSYKSGGAETVSTIAVQAARIMLDNQKWMDDQAEGSWVNQLEVYVKERDIAAYNLNRVTDEEDRDAIKLDLQSKVNALKLENTTWAYYYDRFFDGDDLKVIR